MLTVLSLCERGKINFLISLLLPEHEHFVGSINSALKFRQRITFSPSSCVLLSKHSCCCFRILFDSFEALEVDLLAKLFGRDKHGLYGSKRHPDFLLGMCAVDATTLYFEVCRAFETRSRTLRAILHRFETSIVPV